MTDAAAGPLPVTANFINPETMHHPAGSTQVVKVTAGRPDLNFQQPPASTTVEVRRLVGDDLLIEVEAVAVVASVQPMTGPAEARGLDQGAGAWPAGGTLPP